MRADSLAIASACLRRMRVAIVLLGIGCAAVGNAQATVSTRVVATDPAGESISLGRNQPFNVRIAYATDAPISIWARPYFHGSEVPAMTNASVPHAGSGEALGWFEFIDAGEVDEIRILVSDPAAPKGRQTGSYPVHIVGGDQPPSPHEQAAWVGELTRQDEEARKRSAALRMSEPVSAGDAALMSGFMLTVLGLLVAGSAAPAWALWRWRRGWRLAAAVPAALMLFVVLRFLIDTTRDPTSHNLWPFEMLQASALSVGCMAVLMLARRFLPART